MENQSPILEQNQGLNLTFNTFLTKVFGLMTAGLFVSFSIAFIVMIYAQSSTSALALVGVLAIPAIILQLILVFVISFLAQRVNAVVGSALFLFYSALTGMTLGLIMMSYDLMGIVTALGATFLTFGTMAIFGYVTKRDLSGIGSIAIVGLIGVIIASIFNIFMSFISPAFASGLNWVLTYVGLAIFLILTAWDMQKLKEMSSQAGTTNLNRVAVLGALTLYLDFINIFIYLLRILGGRRD